MKTLEQAMRDKQEELRGVPIKERSQEGKDAYREGFKAGAAQALTLVEKHKGVTAAREDIGHIIRVLDTIAEEDRQ